MTLTEILELKNSPDYVSTDSFSVKKGTGGGVDGYFLEYYLDTNKKINRVYHYSNDTRHGECATFSSDSEVECSVVYIDDELTDIDPFTITPEQKAFLIIQHDLKFIDWEL